MTPANPLKQELESEKSGQQTLNELQAKLDQQLSAHAELETKYANMESEYLTMYEENQQLKERS